jgi:hypothetical protein
MSRGSGKILVAFQHGDVLSVTRSIGRAGASNIRRLRLLVSAGWVPPDLPPSGACLALGRRVSCRLLTPSRVAPHRGCVSSDRRGKLAALLLHTGPRLSTTKVSRRPGNRPSRFREAGRLGHSAKDRAAPLGAVPTGQHDRVEQPVGVLDAVLNAPFLTDPNAWSETDTDPMPARAMSRMNFVRHRNPLGNGPHKAHQCSGNRDYHLIGMFSPSHEAAKAFAQPHLCLPAEVLNGLGLLLESQLQM